MLINLPLFNFILNNFLNSHLATVTVFHCWNTDVVFGFARTVAASPVLWQYVNMNENQAMERFEYRYFNRRHPISGIYLDLNCNRSEEVIQKISHNHFFNEHFHWLVYDALGDLQHFQQIFAQVKLSWNSDLTYAHVQQSQCQTCSFIQYDVYNNGWHIGGKLNMTIDKEVRCDNVGCQVTQYLSELHLKTKYGNRNNLNDITMRVATVITSRNISAPVEELEAFLRDTHSPHIDPIARMAFNMILLLKDMIGCNMRYIYVDSWSTNETSGGSMGHLVGETAELASAPFVQTIARSKYLMATTKSGIFRSVCVFRTPHNSGIQGSVFLEPFSEAVWLLFALLLLLIATILWRAFHIEHYRLQYHGPFVPSFLTSFMITFGLACIQGGYRVPLSNGGRMAFFALSVISFIMYNYYSSIVVSTLLGSPVRSKIKTVGQLADSSLSVGLEKLPYTISYLNTSELPAIRRFVKKKIESRKDPTGIWLPVEMGILKMRNNPGFAYIFEATTGFNLIEKYFEPHQICDLNEILFRSDTSLHTVIHRNQSYKDLIRHNEIRLLETGIHCKHRRYWIGKKLHCMTNNIVISVGLEYAAPFFIILAAGYLLVVFTLCLERACKHYNILNL